MMFKTFYRDSSKKPTIHSDKEFVSRYNKTKENNRYGLPKINNNNIKIDRPSYQTLQEFYALREARRFNSKIGSIRSKPIVPTLNTKFLENHVRLLQYKQNNRKLQQRAISQENQKYQNRIFTTRSAFLRLYGKKFEKSHDERINKIYLKSNKIQILLKTNKGNSAKKNKIVAKDNKTDIDSVNTFDLNQQNQGKRPRRSDIEEFEQDLEENIKNKNKNNENNKNKDKETINNENNNNKKNKDTVNCKKNINSENEIKGNKNTINRENIDKNSSNDINGINNKNNFDNDIYKEKNINSNHNNNEEDRHNNSSKNVHNTNKNNNNANNNSNNNRDNDNDINDKEDIEEF